MLDNRDIAEIKKMLAELKAELRKEMWDASNRNHEDKDGIKIDVADNTDAIIELAELIGGE